MSVMYTSEDRNKILRKSIFIIVGISLLFLCGIFLLINPVTAAQTMNSSVNVTSVTDTTITWQIVYKNTVRPTGATLDGVLIDGFETTFPRNYTATDLKPNTTHEFCIFKDVVNCEKATTTDVKNSFDKIGEFFWLYIYLFCSITLLICCIAVKNPYVGFIGFIIALIGYSEVINVSFEFGFLYGIVMAANIFVSFDVME